MKIRQLGAELFHADRQTDSFDEVIVAFRNFANASNELNRLEIFQFKSTIFI